MIPNDFASRAFIQSGINNLAVLDGRKQTLISPHGQANGWMIDLRRILTRGEYLDAVAEVFWERFKHRLPFQVGGMEVAAIPIISAILMKSVQKGNPINGFIVRKERKTHGAGNLIEGEITNDPIIAVDDAFNSGSSAEKLAVVLADVGHKLSELFALIDYKSDAGQAWQIRHSIEVQSLFTLADFRVKLSKSRQGNRAKLFDIIWSFKSPEPNFFSLVPKSFPTTDGVRVYFGSDNGLFRALDAETGRVVWDFKVNTRGHKNIWSAPALHSGKVYFGSYDGNVYCLDAATGTEIWRNTEAEWVGSSPAIAPDMNRLFIGLEFGVEGRRGAIAAIDLATGETIWSKETKRFTHGSPAYSMRRGLVACGSNDDELWLLNAETGKVVWRFQTRGDGVEGSIRHAPAFYEEGGQVVTGCADGYIYVIDIASGKEVWSYKTGNTIYSVPLVVGGMAYIGSTDKSFYILDLERCEVHTKLDGAAKIFCPPALIDGSIYFGTTDGSLYRVNQKTLDIDGVSQLPDALTNKIAYSEPHKTFYALTYTNQMFALRLH